MQEACAVYWPEEGGAAYGEFKVDITGKEEFPDFIIRKLVVSNFMASLEQIFCCHIHLGLRLLILMKYFCMDLECGKSCG